MFVRTSLGVQKLERAKLEKKGVLLVMVTIFERT